MGRPGSGYIRGMCSRRQATPTFRGSRRPRGSAGVWVVVALALLSTAAVMLLPSSRPEGLMFWTFAKPHAEMYEPLIKARNERTDPDVNMQQLALAVVEQRMLGGFFAGVPTADLIEVERGIAGRAFTGPLESVGFTDLTDRLEAEGLIDAINPASFGPWTSRGRIFGIPHDVHPVMLGYRHDLTEAAGINMASIETWDDFARVMRSIVVDDNRDGVPERYPLAFWPTDLDKVELLVLQGGGRLFAEDGSVDLANDTNAALVARMVSWCVGPDRIACEVPDFSMSGNVLKEAGYAVCYFFPDWMCDVWNKEVASLSGKMRLMPLPAWEPGGLRTSVWGGTMLAIPKTAPDFEACWAFAKYLYFSDELARELYRTGDIISPIKAHWDDPVYDEPDPYFGNQVKGRMYIELAPHIPPRSSSPYARRAIERLGDAGMRTLLTANDRRIYDAESLIPIAMANLRLAEDEVARQMTRTAVFREAGSDTDRDIAPAGDN